MEQFLRVELLIGKEKLRKVRSSSVTVVGLGAVGGYAAEGLARAGVGRLRLVDFDTIKPSNINRQILALHSTVGKPKAALAAERVRDINPAAHAEALELFAAAETIDRILDNSPDLVIDAIDSLNPKARLLKACHDRRIHVISSMGAATRVEPFRIRYGDLLDTEHCPLARRLRIKLKKEGIGRGIKCVYSDERRNLGALDASHAVEEEEAYSRGRRRDKLGSLPTMTGIFGLIIAHKAIEHLCGGFGNSLKKTGPQDEADICR